MPEEHPPKPGDQGLPPEIEADIERLELTELQAGGVWKGIADSQERQRVLLSEGAEKIRKLTWRELRLNPDSPETSPDFLEIARIYDENLVSTESLRKASNDDLSAVMEEIQRGGMLNRFKPTPAEMEDYLSVNPDFISVHDQMIRDMLGRGDRPGTYHVIGLEDPDVPGRFHGWTSFWLPPSSKDPEAVERHRAYLESRLNNPEMIATQAWTFNAGTNVEKLRHDFSTMGEIDTVNIEKDYHGAVYKIFHNVSQFIAQSGREVPGHLLYYRSDVLVLNQGSNNEEYLPMQNSRTFSVAKNLGCFELASVADPKDVVCRELTYGDVWRMHARWRYGQFNMKRFAASAEGHARRKGFIG